MSVGDSVKLKNTLYNNLKYLERYHGRKGIIINTQYDRSGRLFVRVVFENTSFYEDLLAKRLEIITK